MLRPLSANAGLMHHVPMLQGWKAWNLTNLHGLTWTTTVCSAVEPCCISNPHHHIMLCQPLIAVTPNCRSICPSHLLYQDLLCLLSLWQYTAAQVLHRTTAPTAEQEAAFAWWYAALDSSQLANDCVDQVCPAWLFSACKACSATSIPAWRHLQQPYKHSHTLTVTSMYASGSYSSEEGGNLCMARTV